MSQDHPATGTTSTVLDVDDIDKIAARFDGDALRAAGRDMMDVMSLDRVRLALAPTAYAVPGPADGPDPFYEGGLEPYVRPKPPPGLADLLAPLQTAHRWTP